MSKHIAAVELDGPHHRHASVLRQARQHRRISRATRWVCAGLWLCIVLSAAGSVYLLVSRPGH